MGLNTFALLPNTILICIRSILRKSNHFFSSISNIFIIYLETKQLIRRQSSFFPDNQNTIFSCIVGTFFLLFFYSTFIPLYNFSYIFGSLCSVSKQRTALEAVRVDISKCLWRRRKVSVLRLKFNQDQGSCHVWKSARRRSLISEFPPIPCHSFHCVDANWYCATVPENGFNSDVLWT